MKVAFIALIFVTKIVYAISIEGDVTMGKNKANTCIACHGVDGNGIASNFPKIAGQHSLYLYKQLKDFKSGLRRNDVMAASVANLTDEDMKNLAVYYEQQQTSTNTAANNLEQLELGRKIYIGGKKATNTAACIACHGPQGKGIPSANFPKLSFQYASYTSQQLKLFRQVAINKQTGDNKQVRANDYELMMQNIAKNLTNTEIEALAQYIAGLH